MVTYELRESVAVIQMDDGKVNALSHQMVDALLAAIERAENEAQAIVLAGRPGKFCAGFDLKTMTSSPAAAVELLTRGCDLYMRLYGCPLPVIIAASGHAVAGGALLVLCGDYRIGIEGPFKVGLNEVAIQMPIPILAIELARDRLLPSALTEATLGARLYDAADAVSAGYLDTLVRPDDLLATALEKAAAWGAYDRRAFADSKMTLRGSTIEGIQATLMDDMARFSAPAPA